MFIPGADAVAVEM